ncbi:Uncharacterised protein [Mycobacteroides abscessus subsp. abscessus]|nr:Uncharacterised protein [Mycobacteroides abscessus subsp. abscessus]
MMISPSLWISSTSSWVDLAWRSVLETDSWRIRNRWSSTPLSIKNSSTFHWIFMVTFWESSSSSSSMPSCSVFPFRAAGRKWRSRARISSWD